MGHIEEVERGLYLLKSQFPKDTTLFNKNGMQIDIVYGNIAARLDLEGSRVRVTSIDGFVQQEKRYDGVAQTVPVFVPGKSYVYLLSADEYSFLLGSKAEQTARAIVNRHVNKILAEIALEQTEKGH